MRQITRATNIKTEVVSTCCMCQVELFKCASVVRTTMSKSFCLICTSILEEALKNKEENPELLSEHKS